MAIEKRRFGNTGLEVSILGFGAGEIGDLKIEEKEAEKILNSVLDLGITLIDTARAYGTSEDRIGKYLSRRRDEFVLSTKIGYGIEGHQDWTYGCIIAGVDEALRLLRTDHIDIVHFHSCPIETLKKGEVVDALEKVVKSGKVRVAAYSGENEALDFSVRSGRFGSIQTSVNICDQRAIDSTIAMAGEKGMGVIAKRPIANAPWRFRERPAGHYCEEYWARWTRMQLDFDIEPQELFLRFALFADGVHSSIAGTTSLEHLKRNAEIAGKGALPQEIVTSIRDAFRNNDENWTGQV